MAVRVFTLIAVAILAMGCAERPTSSAQRSEAVLPPSPTVEFVPNRRFDRGTNADWRNADIQVRLQAEQDAIKDRPMGAAEGVVFGGGMLGMGTGAALLSPMAGGAFVGGVIIFPMAIFFGVQNDIWIHRFEVAVADVDFPSRVREATASRLVKAGAPPLTDGEYVPYRLEIAIVQYGIVGNCFGFVGVMSVWHGLVKEFEDGLNWEAGRRNRDFPPARCASLEEFADEDARLFRKTLIEASFVIAAVIADRLGVGP